MPDRRRGAVGEERDGAAPVGAQGREVLAGEMAVMRRRAKPVTGQPDRLGAKFGPGQPSVFAVHHAEPGEHAGHRHRERAGARNAAGVALGGRGKRRRAGAVEHDGAAALRVEHMVEGVAAEPRHHRFDDAERERRRERGVDRVAAGAQRHETGLRRQGVVRRDSAAPPDDQGPITADVLVHAGSVGWPNHHTLPQRPLWARKGRDGSETAEAPSRPLHIHSDSCVAALPWSYGRELSGEQIAQYEMMQYEMIVK